MTHLAKRTTILTAAACATIAAAATAWDWYDALPPDALAAARYVGGANCAQCHQQEDQDWRGSHHDRAMEPASDESVLGDFDDASFTRHGVTSRFFRRDGKFFVNTEGPDGQHHDYLIKYTFGVDPLQQYMVEFPDGRVQVLRVSWDTNRQQWFYVTPPDVPDERILPGDPMHWTGLSQNWNTTCAECHSTGLGKNYELATDSYHTTFAQIDVSCEECHGPGSVHVELARRWSLFWDRNVGHGLARLESADPTVELEACAKCHSRRTQIQQGFRPGRPLLNYYEPSLLLTGLYFDDGQILDEVYEYGSFLQSKMYANHVRCSNCHEPHTLEPRSSGNKLCGQCHQPGKYDTQLHHHHPPDKDGTLCVECHMRTRFYMVVDERHDHSFRIPRPDLTVSLGLPNACNDCHTEPEETAQWAADKVREWYGDRRPDDPHWAPALAAGNAGSSEGEQLLVKLVRRRTAPAIVRATAVALLAGYGGHQSVAARGRALNDADPWVRTAAVRAVSADMLPSVTSDLVRRLSDRIRIVRMAAAVQLTFLPSDTLPANDRARLDHVLDEFRESQQYLLDHAHGNINLGVLERQLGHPQRAADHFRDAIRVEPYRSGPRNELALLLQQLGGDPAEIRRLREEEVELLQRDVELLGDSRSAYYRLGLLQYLLGRLDDAAEAMTQACRLAPRVYGYRVALALVEERRYELTGDTTHFDAAVASLRKLHELEPDDPRAGQILQRLLETRRKKQSTPGG